MTQRFATVSISVEKLRDYCLSDTHPRGRHKARVFMSRLGLGPDDAERLGAILAEVATERRDQIILGEIDEYGERYILDFPFATEVGSATIRSAWIVRRDEDVLRFVSCFVL